MGGRLLRVAGVAALVMAPLPLALPAAATPALTAPAPAADASEPVAADPYVPPARRQLQPSDIRVQRGPDRRQLQFVTTSGRPWRS